MLEFMFQINKFGESPHNFPPDSTETALVNNECSEEKVSAPFSSLIRCPVFVRCRREFGFVFDMLISSVDCADGRKEY